MTKLNLGSLFFFLIRLPFSFNTPLILQEIVVVVITSTAQFLLQRQPHLVTIQPRQYLRTLLNLQFSVISNCF